MTKREMPSQFQFVLSEHDGKTKANSRSLIRSHCMKGRNLQHNSRRSIRKAKQVAKDATALQLVSPPSSPYPKSSKPNTNLTLSQSGFFTNYDRHFRRIATSLPDIDRALLFPWITPPPPHTDVLVRFASKTAKSPTDILKQAICFSNITTATYPLELCLDFNEPEASINAQWAFLEEDFYHTIFFATSAMCDFSLNGQLTKPTRAQLGAVLVLLNQRLSKTSSAVSEATIYTILCLALVAASVGDWMGVDMHINGLQRIVKLKGGLKSLDHQPTTRFKLQSLDFMHCLSFGGVTRFGDSKISWEPCFDIHDTQIPTTGFLTDSRVKHIFRDLQILTKLLLSSFESGTRYPESTFQPTMTSIQSRLLYLENDLKDNNSIDELVCVAMLAFLSTMSRVPGRRRTAMRYLSTRVRQTCRNITHLTEYDNPTSSHTSELVIWILLVFSISVLDTDDPWLVETWSRVTPRGLTWQSTQQGLSRTMWIGFIQNDMARVSYNNLMSSISA